jgi:hypothetical protein
VKTVTVDSSRVFGGRQSFGLFDAIGQKRPEIIGSDRTDGLHFQAGCASVDFLERDRKKMIAAEGALFYLRRYDAVTTNVIALAGL